MVIVLSCLVPEQSLLLLLVNALKCSFAGLRVREQRWMTIKPHNYTYSSSCLFYSQRRFTWLLTAYIAWSGQQWWWRVFDNYLWWHSVEMRASKSLKLEANILRIECRCRLQMISINDQNEIRSLCCLHTVFNKHTRTPVLHLLISEFVPRWLSHWTGSFSLVLLYINKNISEPPHLQEVTTKYDYTVMPLAAFLFLVPFISWQPLWQ